MQWTVCGYETEVSEAVDNPEEALSPMASGKPPAVGGEASISKSCWSGFITEDTVQRPSSEKEKHTMCVLHIAEENAAENVLTCWKHMFKMETTYPVTLVRKAGGPGVG